MADQYDIVEIPLYELVHEVLDLLYIVHPFLYTFPMAEERTCDSLIGCVVQSGAGCSNSIGGAERARIVVDGTEPMSSGLTFLPAERTTWISGSFPTVSSMILYP